jgi:ZIP family zinc transporter
VSYEKTLLLGFIAGVTIFLGLPIGRLKRPAPNLRAMLNAIAVGILIFLIWDVLSAAWEPIDTALSAYHAGHGGLGDAIGYGLLLTAGLGVGLLGLVAYERWMDRRAGTPDVTLVDPETDEPVVVTDPRPSSSGARAGVLTRLGGWSPARQLALMVAVGIGLHNFAEGLAIGQAAAKSEVALATLLVVGFGLHNATEGFGITAPLAGETDARGDRLMPSWGLLVMLGVIGGGPTFIGTAIGYSFTSEWMSVTFLALAAGSILYVVLQLVGVAAKTRRMDLLAYGVFIGLVAGFLTDAIVTAAGA